MAKMFALKNLGDDKVVREANEVIQTAEEVKRRNRNMILSVDSVENT